MTTVKEFLQNNYHLDCRSCITVGESLKRFRKSLPTGLSITRQAFINAVVEAGFPVGRDSSGSFAIGGLSATEPKRFQVVSGRL